jgi:hypothetical protein
MGVCSDLVDSYAKQCFCFDFLFGTWCGAIILQWPLAQLFPAAWAGYEQVFSLSFLDVYREETFFVAIHWNTFHSW